MRRWKVAGAPNKPNGSVTNWCNPNGVVKAVFSLDKNLGQMVLRQLDGLSQRRRAVAPDPLSRPPG